MIKKLHLPKNAKDKAKVKKAAKDLKAAVEAARMFAKVGTGTILLNNSNVSLSGLLDSLKKKAFKAAKLKASTFAKDKKAAKKSSSAAQNVLLA